jgi:hypothetical protein
MPPTNGLDSDAALMERLIGLVARVNDALRDFSEEQRRSSAHLERLESAVEKVRDIAVEVKHHLAEARDDIEKVREDTNPHGFKLLDPARYPLNGKKDDSGKLVALARAAEKLPPGWGKWLLGAVLPAAGAAALRFAQWLTTGH